MKPWEDGTAEVAREEIDAENGPSPVRFNQSIAHVVDGPVKFRRLESNNLLAEAVVQADAVARFMKPFGGLTEMTEAARSLLVEKAASIISSAQLVADPQDRMRHLRFGKKRLKDIAEALDEHEGRLGVGAVRRQLKEK
jgi:ABC-type branched-subunit amino acid transport system ATPase component